MSRENGSLFPGVQREGDSKLNQTLKRTVTIKALKHRTGFTTGRLGMLTMAQSINRERKAAKLFKKKSNKGKMHSFKNTVYAEVVFIPGEENKLQY